MDITLIALAKVVFVGGLAIECVRECSNQHAYTGIRRIPSYVRLGYDQVKVRLGCYCNLKISRLASIDSDGVIDVIGVIIYLGNGHLFEIIHKCLPVHIKNAISCL